MVLPVDAGLGARADKRLSAARPGAESLADKMTRIGDPVRMLRDSASARFKSPYPEQYTTWQDEQEAWRSSAVLFDQSHHMTDVYFSGPDVARLFSDTCTNSFVGFGRNRAKHVVACAPDGNIIGTAVLFGLEDSAVNLVGPAAAANWIQYQSETGGYDVDIVRDERTRDQRGGSRLTFRYEIEGPATEPILERLNEGPLEQTPFFWMTEFTLAGVPVRALVHTMAGVPGAASMGMEIFGPAAHGPRCWDSLLEAGAEYGIRAGGMLAYYTGAIESGYAAQPTPAIYTDSRLDDYRRWLSADGYEASISIGGSFVSDDVADYYVSPWNFGYAHLVKFDHDFIGRSALEKSADEPRCRKVWLRWNDDDVTRTYAGSLFGGTDRTKYLETPLARYARVMADRVERDGRLIGRSTIAGYTVNIGCWASVAFIDEAHAVDGSEVTVLWGEEDGGTSKLTVERHRQTSIRATIRTRPLSQHP